jgi:hypothetical protein
VAKTKKAPPDRAQARRQFLALRPVRNPNIDWEDVDDHAVLILKRGDDWRTRVLHIFFPLPEERRVVLDPIGSLVWRGCDGQTTIEKLSQELQREYKLGGREAELSLQQFFKDLGRRGYIAFAVEKKVGVSSAEPEKKKGWRK